MSIDPRLDQIIDCLYRVAVKAVIIKNGKVLLMQDTGDKGWTFPGGGVDHGENTEQALRRELSEEIGITESDVVCNNKIEAVFIGHVKDDIPRCNIHFKVALDTNDLRPTQETEKLEWIPTTDLEHHAFDSSAGPKTEIINLIKRLS